ncbi:MAG: winged helix DNA-binding domain-containing protein [Candidatus Heimdallarchaeota archaeon]|nr:winged helix DNA-binding domain-containing protein [Candidatus Heimdallarchaeota archaeon]
MEKFSIEQINRYILHKQHLTAESKTSNIMIVTRDIGGLHSTSQTTPYLSLFNRIDNFSRNQLDEEAYVKKNLGKIRCIRKTVFIHNKEFVPWIIQATKKQHAKRHVDYLVNLGVSEMKYQKLVEDILKVLEGRNLSVSEIKKELNSSENISAMVNLACDQFKIIRNKPIKSWRDRRHTYSAFEEYFPDMNLEEYSEEESRTKLVRYYLECFGPVTLKDIAWWAGFTITETRIALEKLKDYATQNPIDPKGLLNPQYMLTRDLERLAQTAIPDQAIINLLPDLDPYMMGYKERTRYVNQKFYDYIFDRSGNATTTILINGKVKGIWDFISSKKPIIKFFLLEKLSKELLEEVKNQLDKMGRFIFEEDVVLMECKTMDPLKTRTPGEVQTPLKYC